MIVKEVEILTPPSHSTVNMIISYCLNFAFSCHIFMLTLFINQAYVHKSVMEELKRIIDDSEITKEDDALWPPPDRVGRQVCGFIYNDDSYLQ